MPASPAGYSINPVPPNSTANLPPTPLPTPAPARCDTRGKSRPIGHSALWDFELTYDGLGSPATEEVEADSPPLKWSDLRYVFDIQEDCNGKEAIQA